jgi:hypothetical protein
MKLMPVACALLLTVFVASGCTGTRSAGGYYTVHAESFRLFGWAIPSDDQEAAVKLHAEKYPGSTITSTHSTPADWTSFWGVVGKLFSFHQTEISGTTK